MGVPIMIPKANRSWPLRFAPVTVRRSSRLLNWRRLRRRGVWVDF